MGWLMPDIVLRARDWRDCEHKWIPGETGMNYRFQCTECGIYSYIGPAYNSLPDKSKSVFLTGIVWEKE